MSTVVHSARRMLCSIGTPGLTRTVVISVVLALGVALIPNGPIKLRPFWRAAFFMPYVTAPVAIAIVWRNILDADWGC